MLDGCRKNGLNLNAWLTLTSLLTFTEASVTCNAFYSNVFVCNDDGDREAYCCDMKFDGSYHKCCFREDPISPQDPSDETGDWGYTWIAVFCFVLLVIISCCLQWCRRLRRQEEITRSVEAAIQRSTAQQTQAQRAQIQRRAQMQRQAQAQQYAEIQRPNVEVRPPVESNSEEPPPSYDEVTGGGRSDEYKELLSDYLYAGPRNYQSTGESPNAPPS